jgi:hypothetical protein
MYSIILRQLVRDSLIVINTVFLLEAILNYTSSKMRELNTPQPSKLDLKEN